MRSLLIKHLVALLALFLGLMMWAGITPAYLLAAPSMVTGIGAKLGCSGKYVGGLSNQQAFDDIAAYSPVLSYLELDFDDRNQRVSASFLGIKTTSARFLPTMGCVLELGNEPFDVTPALLSSNDNAIWPAGHQIESPKASLQKQLETRLKQDNQLGYDTRALLVAKNGKVVAEAYAADFDANTKFLGWSMAKSFTALMAGSLELSEKLSVDESQLFDVWKNDERSEISIENLLTMTSGLRFDESYQPGDDVTTMLFMVDSTSDYAMQSPSDYSAGDHWEYSSGTTALISRIIHEKLGGNLTASLNYWQEQFVEPLALQNAVFEPDASGVLVGSSYLYATARDWAKLGQVMLNKGELNGNRVVSEEWIDRATSPNQSQNKRSYGYQFWLNKGDSVKRWPDLPEDSFAALGSRKQVVMAIPSEELVVVRLGWTTGNYPTNDLVATLIKNLNTQSEQTMVRSALE